VWSGCRHPGVVAAFGLPKHAVDFLNGSHQFLSFGLIDVHLAGTAEFGCFPEGVVEIREGGEVIRLEVVGPEDHQLLLGLGGFLFLDRDITRKGVVVGRQCSSITSCRSLHALEFFSHGENGFRCNASGGRVIDAARAVAVGLHCLSRQG